MRDFGSKLRKYCARVYILLVGALVLALANADVSRAQEQPSNAAGQPSMNAADQSQPLQDQIAALRAQVAKLQAAIDSKPAAKANRKPGMKMNSSPTKNKPMVDEAGEMSMAPGGAMGMSDMDDMDEMGGMQANAPSGKKMGMMMSEMGGMMSKMGDMMGEMGNMSGMSPSPSPAKAGVTAHSGSHANAAGSMSSLPGFPGASHLYHIGATGFFLDHSDEIGLTADQQASLNRIKEKALLDRATTQRRIDEAEQELWALTAADQPEQSKIQSKIEQIEKLRGEQRLAFIRAVGEGAKLLTLEQRQALLGAAAGSKGR